MSKQNATEINSAIIAAKIASDAAQVARDVATRAAETAAKVADTAAKTAENYLLLAQKVDYMQGTIDTIKNNLDNKYVTLSQHAIVEKDILENGKNIADHEIRLRRVEQWGLAAAGALAAAQFYFSYIHK